MNEFTAKERFAAAAVAREDLYTFSRWMFLQRKGYPWLQSPHHKIMCDALMRVFRGECRRLIINVPPRYSKTELAIVNFIAWSMGKVPDAEFIHASYSGTLATENSTNVRALIQHEAYTEIFPECVLSTEARAHWKTTRGGVMYATGAGGTITGFGAGKHREGFGGAILIDDPHKADEATSDVIRKGVLDWFQNTLESRKNDPQRTPIIVIMQRLHEQDLTGWLLAGGNGETWEHVCLPALDEVNDTPLWPAKHTFEMLQEMKAANSYVFSGQYQQRPSPLGGGILKGQWFRRYAVMPRFVYRKIFADTAQKTAERNDYSVFECWGATDDGNAYLIDMIRGKWEAPELKRRAVDFWNKQMAVDPVAFGALRQLAVEDKSSGTGLIQDLSYSSSIPVIGIERVKDKLTRVMDVAGYVESGRVYLPEDAPFVADFIHECEAFTPDDTHMWDDQIDPMCDALNDMVATTSSRMVWAKLAG